MIPRLQFLSTHAERSVGSPSGEHVRLKADLQRLTLPRLLAFTLVVLWPLAGTAATANHLDQLLEQIQQTQKQEAAVRKQREQHFLAARSEQKRLLEEVKAKLAAEKALSERLRTAFDNNEQALAELEAELKRQTGDLGEVFGTVRQTAKDLTVLFRDSLVSAQYPGRADWLAQLGESKKLPASAELERLWHLIQQETVESGRVVRFPAGVIDTNGTAGQGSVVRVGLFNALSEGRYLTYQPETGRFVVLPRQPSNIGDQLMEGGDNSPALDPTRGVLLSLLVETPDPAERLHQGGAVGYVILGLGGLGLLIVLVRLAYLAVTGGRIRKQLGDLANPCNKNPLGRILAVAADNPNTDTGHLELQIDEAILRELPRLTRGEGLVKLLAGVAPLLGLLGTVVGMIATFQAITLFGTGDPKMMANGISQALVTTAEGLIVAIPLLFLHSLMASRSQALVQILDEQSVGLVAASKEATADV